MKKYNKNIKCITFIIYNSTYKSIAMFTITTDKNILQLKCYL